MGILRVCHPQRRFWQILSVNRDNRYKPEQVLAEKAAKGKDGSLLSQMPAGQRKLVTEARVALEKLAKALAKG